MLVAQLFDWYLEPRATLYQLARRLTDLGVATPTGKPRWNVASVRGILRNPAYAGRALTNRTRVAPARAPQVGDAAGRAGGEPCPAAGGGLDRGAGPADRLRGDLRPGAGQAGYQPAGRGPQHPARVPAARAGQLRRVPAGVHRPPDRAPATATTCAAAAPTPLRAAEGQRCTARYIPAGQLDELVWADLCALLTDPAQVAHALARARAGPGCPRNSRPGRRPSARPWASSSASSSGCWTPTSPRSIGLPEFERKRQELDRRRDHPARPAAPAGGRRPAAAGTQRRRRRDRGLLPDRPGRAGHRHLRPAAAAGRAAHRPGDRHRRRGRDPLRAANLPRRAAPPFLPVAESSQRSW